MAPRKSSSRKKSGRKYGKAAGKIVASAMRRKKSGTLRSGKGGKGGKVTSRKQAIAIGLSESAGMNRHVVGDERALQERK
jgi:hypothetical protein